MNERDEIWKRNFDVFDKIFILLKKKKLKMEIEEFKNHMQGIEVTGQIETPMSEDGVSGK